MRFVVREKVDAPQAHSYSGKIESYKGRFFPLIEAEKRCSEKVIIDRLTSWGVEKLKDEGYCMTGVMAFWLSRNNFGRPVAGFKGCAGESLPFHRFTYGTQVLISRLDPLQEDGMMKGSVVKVTYQQIDIAFEDIDTVPATYEDVGTGLWRLDLGHSGSAYERMREAIDRFHFDPEKIERDRKNTPDKWELVLHGTSLRDVLLSNIPSEPGWNLVEGWQGDALSPAAEKSKPPNGAFCDDMRIQSWARRYMRRKPVVIEGDPHIPGLNASQIRAMATMIGERISLVHGPPGTGKTRTIVETISLLKRHFEVPHPILVCTYTHAAVNNILESFVDNGLKPLRVGFDGKMLAQLEPYMLEYQFESHRLKPLYEEVCSKKKTLDKEFKELMVQIKKQELSLEESSDKNVRLEEVIRHDKTRLSNLERRRNALKRSKYKVSQRIMRNLVQNADVICTTCVRSAFHMLDVVDFPVVFLDEASMSTEPASLIPLMKGCRHLALIGDHKQLPPVVVSLEAERGGLGKSLFERLTEEGNVPTVMLDTQYRMHPAISKFPSMEFYDEMLLDGTVQSGQISPSLMPPSSMHLIPHPQTGERPSVIFIDHQGHESAKSNSRVNYTEAYILCNIVQDLLLQNADLNGTDIGIIAPYKSQVNLITRLFLRDSVVRNHLAMTLGGEARASEITNVEVKTVDGFEGRQKDVIIFSTVRNNQPGHIGFLADKRRMNVGLTRAKRALFVIGNMSTLSIGTYGRNTSHMDAILGDSVKAERIHQGAEAWRNFARFLGEQNLVLKLRGESLKKVLRPFRY